MRVILRFGKGSEVKYISHLDTQRLFQRALRRAKLPVAYSQGYNPHSMLSFACALPLNVCSNSEYFEVKLESFVAPEEVKSRLNGVLPKGVCIINAFEPKDDYPNIGSVIEQADYTFETPDKDCTEKIAELLSRKEIIISKKTKKGVADVDVRNMIKRLEYSGGRLFATLSCSNSENLRADKLVEILAEAGITALNATRLELYIMLDNKLQKPLGYK